MIGLDTNILLRLVADLDDVDQTRRVRDMVQARCSAESPGYINLIVLCELAWVLRSVYGYSGDDVLKVVDLLLMADSISVEDRLMVVGAISLSRQHKVGLADALIGLRNRDRGCATTVSFDRRCLRLAEFTAPLT